MEEECVGTILSGSTTTEATCQLLESAERGGIREGMLLIVETNDNRKILSRVAQIIPYNDFYTTGDVWSEARRKNLPIPEDIARKYEICKLDLLMEIPRKEIKNPPQPGDKVIKIDPTKHKKEIFGVGKDEPGYIWYGSLIGYKDKVPIPLDVEAIPMHLAIFGVTGSGKSFDTGCLIEKLVEIQVKNGEVSYPMIIIDAHGDYIGYVNYFINKGKVGNEGWIKRYVFPKARMRPDLRKKGIYPIGINLNSLSSKEIAEIILLYYKGTTEGSELQITAIDNLLDWMVKDKAYPSVHDVFLNYFDELVNERLDEFAEEREMHRSTKGAVKRALESFITIEKEHKLLSTSSELKNDDFVDKITKEGGIAVIDFSADGAPGVDLKTKQFVMTYLASVLFDKFTKYKLQKEDRFLLFVIEEAQNFCPDKSYPISSSLAHSKLSAIATQGRKFGLSLCLITQRPSFVDRIVLSMCNTFFVHRISPEDISFVKSVSGIPSSMAPRLTTMDAGDIIICGQMVPLPFPLLIHVPKEERKVKETIGKVKVCENLAKLRGI